MTGDIIKAYSDEVEDLGFTENSMIDRDDYEPESTAHKSYYVQGENQSGVGMSGNYEQALLELKVSVLLEYPIGGGYAEAEKDNWNLIDTIKIGLMALAATRQDHLQHVNTAVTRVGDYKLFEMYFNCNYNQSLVITT